jgi:flagellar biosynthesis GTPase FlhF
VLTADGRSRKRAADLYDSVGKTLLDDEFFPHPSLCDPVSISSLRMLGLRNVLDRDAILASARSIPGIVEAGQNEIRAKMLLRYMDKHADELFLPSTQTQGFFKFLSTKNSREEKLNIRAFVSELLSLSWVPSISITNPWEEEEEEENKTKKEEEEKEKEEKNKKKKEEEEEEEEEENKKKKNKIKKKKEEPAQKITIAKPLQTRLYVDRWLCSASLSIVSPDVEIRSSLLLDEMGWRRKL